MVGKSVQMHHDVVEDVIQAGHAIGIHGWDHSSFVEMSFQEQRRQIRSCIQAFKPYKSQIFRPPYGHQNILSHLNIRSMKCEVVGWDLDVSDWLFHDSNSLANELMNKLQPGSIALLHDAIFIPEAGVNSNRQSTLDAIDQLLGYFDNNMKFVTVPDLFSYGNLRRVNWYRK